MGRPASRAERAQALAGRVAALPEGARRSYVLALLAFASGRPDHAEDLLRTAWRHSVRCGAEPADDLRARIAGRLCQVCYLQLRNAEAVEWGIRAHQADPRHAPWLITSLALAGRSPELVGPGEGGPETAAARGARELWTEDLVSARSELRAAVRGLRDSGRFMARLQATGYLVLTEYRLGAWDDAIRHADEAVSLAEDADQSWILARLHSYTAMPHAARGDLERARRHVDAAFVAAAVTGLRLDVVGSTISAAHVAATAGEPAAVVELLEPLARTARTGQTAEPGVSIWPCLLADALVALDRVDEAEEVLAPFERRAAELERRIAQSTVARSRGRIEAARGRRDGAVRAFRAAVAHADAAAADVEGALARFDLGAFLRRSGRRRDAAAQLRAARVVLHRLGAGPALSRCDRELEACGLTPMRHGARGAGRLTPRELAVARLAAGGLSNPQVAAELVVSLNTVEFHLRNVFAKLGIGSRTEIAGHLEAVE